MAQPSRRSLSPLPLACGVLLLVVAAGCKEKPAGRECDAGLTVCGLACVNKQRDPQHCGACGVRCEAGHYCSSGYCVPFCDEGFVSCGQGAQTRCVLLQTDPSDCGECGVACGLGQQCAKGVCGCADAMLSQCGRDCIALQGADRENCGACGARCPGSSTCEGGSCQCPAGADSERLVFAGSLPEPLTDPLSGDLSGDGRADVVARNENGVFLVERTVDGFAGPRRVGTDETNLLFALGDVEGDGRLDVLATTIGSVRVWLNRLPADFEAGPQLAKGPVSALGVVDLEGDHSSPAVVMETNAGLVAWDPQTGAERLLHAHDGKGGWLAIADLDGDGRPDFVYPPFSIVWNRVDGMVLQEVEVERQVGRAVVLDVGADGLLDVVLGHVTGGLSLFRHRFADGRSQFERSASIAYGVMDDLRAISAPDGTAQVLMVSERHVASQGIDREGAWAGASEAWQLPFSNGMLFPAGEPAAMDAFAFVRRLGSTSGSIVYELRSTPAFWEPARQAWHPLPGIATAAAAMADFDGDGIADLAAAVFDAKGKCDNGPTVIAFLRGQPSGGFGHAQVAFTSTLFRSSAELLPVARLGGGHDLILHPEFLRLEGLEFTRLAISPKALASADLDGDGIGDLVMEDSVAWGKGTGGFVSERFLTCGAKPEVADLDGDGLQDIVTLGAGGLCIHFNEGRRSFSKAKVPVAPQARGTGSVIAGDVTGDGLPDLTVPRHGGHFIMTNEGEGRFRERFSDTRSLKGAQRCDLDGDGRMDLLLEKGAIYSRDGRFSGVVRIPVDRTPRVVTDLDGDGRSEILELAKGELRSVNPPACP